MPPYVLQAAYEGAFAPALDTREGLGCFIVRMHGLTRLPGWIWIALALCGAPGLVLPRREASEALAIARQRRADEAEARWLAERRPLPESPLRSRTWLVEQEGTLERRTFGTMRVEVQGDRVLAVAQDRPDRAITGAVRVEHGWVFFTDDRMIAASDTFTGRLRVLGRMGCVAVLDGSSQGRAVIRDASGAVWTTDGRDPIARMRVPDKTLKVVFHTARYGLTQAEDGALWETRDAGHAWARVTDIRAWGLHATRAGVRAATDRGLLLFREDRSPGAAPESTTEEQRLGTDGGYIPPETPLGRALEARFQAPVRVLETPSASVQCGAEALALPGGGWLSGWTSYGCAVRPAVNRKLYGLVGHEPNEEDGRFDSPTSQPGGVLSVQRPFAVETGLIGMSWRGADVRGAFEASFFADAGRPETARRHTERDGWRNVAVTRGGAVLLTTEGLYRTDTRGEVRVVEPLKLPSSEMLVMGVAHFDASLDGGVFGVFSWQQSPDLWEAFGGVDTLRQSLTVHVVYAFSLRADGTLEHSRWWVRRAMPGIAGWGAWGDRQGPVVIEGSGEEPRLAMLSWEGDRPVALPTPRLEHMLPCNAPPSSDAVTLYREDESGVSLSSDRDPVDFEGDVAPFAFVRGSVVEVSPRSTCLRRLDYSASQTSTHARLFARGGVLVGVEDDGYTQSAVRCR